MSQRRGLVLVDAVRTKLWPLPALAVVVAVGLGITLPLLDEALSDDLPPALANFLIGGGADAARSILQATAGSLITVTSLTFSLTVVTLQLASSQFSPRLLRMFTADRTVHATLGLFLGTFAYALTVLRTVRTGDDGGGEFVPHISVTFAFVLAIASVLGLVFFLAHLAREIRVETMMKRVHRDTDSALRRVFPERNGLSPAPVEPTDNPVLIRSRGSGFMVGIDGKRLLEIAEEHGVVILIEREPGASVTAGVPFARAWPLSAETPDAGRLSDSLANAITLDYERTVVEDVSFGFRQLTDVASKALSPGINDPTTAVLVLGHSAALLCVLTQRDVGPQCIRDKTGRIRVILHQLNFAEFLDLAIAQPRLYGMSDPTVMERILRLLQEVGWCATQASQRSALQDQLRSTVQAMDSQEYAPGTREQLNSSVDAVGAALAQRWVPRN